MTKLLLAFLLAAAPAASTQNPSWALLPFTKADKQNPALTPGGGSFADPILHQRVCRIDFANFHHQLFLYYGTADSKIAVATRPEDAR